MAESGIWLGSWAPSAPFLAAFSGREAGPSPSLGPCLQPSFGYFGAVVLATFGLGPGLRPEFSWFSRFLAEFFRREKHRPFAFARAGKVHCLCDFVQARGMWGFHMVRTFCSNHVVPRFALGSPARGSKWPRLRFGGGRLNASAWRDKICRFCQLDFCARFFSAADG